MARPKAPDDITVVECRTFGHAWERFVATTGPTRRALPRYGWLWSLRCVRCGTERHDTIDVNGEMQTRSYNHPDNYAYAADETPTRAEFRKMLHDAVDKNRKSPRAARSARQSSRSSSSPRRLRSVS